MGVGRLVGRTHELSWLFEAVERARSGARTVAVVEGEAGVGKSRLLREAVAAYRTPKDSVGIGFGVELTGGEIPYGIATDLLRTLVRDIGVEQVRAAAGSYAPALVPLCPDLGPDGDVEATAARVFPAFVSMVEQLSSERLVWLIVEDLPWVDRSSRDLLSYLVRAVQSGQVMITATLRTHDPATDPAVFELLDQVTTLDGVDRLALTCLQADETAHLVADLTADAATDEQVAGIVATSNGNPLLAEQLVAAGLDDPTTVANPMVARIQRLDASTRRLVQLAALGEGHVLHQLLNKVYAGAEADFDAAVDDALSLRLLEYHAEEREFAFTHPLLREAADRTLTPGDRLRGHRRWGEALSSADSQYREARFVIARAQHWAETDEATESFCSALEAAKTTQILGATTQTAVLLTRAWELWDQVEDAQRLAECAKDDILIEACETFQAADAADKAVGLIERALYQAGAEPDGMRHLCLRICREIYQEDRIGRFDEAVTADALRVTRGLLMLPPSGPVVMALHELGWMVRWTDPALSLDVHRRALELTREVRHPSFVGLAAYVLADTLSLSGRFQEAADVCAEAMGEVVSVLDIVSIETSQADTLSRSGQFKAAAAIGLRALDRLPDPELAPFDWVHAALRMSGYLEALGEWQQAESLLRQCASLNLSDQVVGTFVDARTAIFACWRGELDKAKHLCAGMLEALPNPEETAFFPRRHLVRHACAETTLELGDHVHARELIQPVLQPTYAESDLGLWESTLLAARIEADMAETNGPDARSDEVSQWIRLVAEHFPRAGDLDEPRRLHLEAEFARAGFQDTADLWSGARELWRSVEHVPNRAWAALHLAEVLVRSGDRSAAADPLREAWEIADRLGAVPLRDRAVDLAYRARIPIEQRREQNQRGPLGRLTERELEVLRHLAAGESNAEIAESLFISPKTASVHVSRILTKLDVNSRAKATAIAIREGINDSPIDKVE